MEKTTFFRLKKYEFRQFTALDEAYGSFQTHFFE
jgi:hypothetical protein